VDGISAPPGTWVYDPEMPIAADLIQLAVTTVPEPNTLALFAVSVTAFGVVLRRRRPLTGLWKSTG
jgi:PEP-CTERM motif